MNLASISDRLSKLANSFASHEVRIGNMYLDVDAIPSQSPQPNLTYLSRISRSHELVTLENNDIITKRNTMSNYQKPSNRIWRGAVLGDQNHQYQVGEWYRLGQMVPRDLFQARSWYQKAADSGHLLAAQQLAKFH